jgi:hypothetical protein
MSLPRAEYLINRLISNNLSEDELSELLAGVGHESEQQGYSDILESYFNRLVRENGENPGLHTGSDKL